MLEQLAVSGGDHIDTFPHSRERFLRRFRALTGQPTRHVVVGIVTALLMSVMSPLLQAAEEEPPSSETTRVAEIAIGIDGRFKVGRWTPLTVSLAGDVARPLQLAVWAPDPDGNVAKQPSDVVSFSDANEPRLRSVFQTGRMDGVVRIDLEADGEVIESRTLRSAADTDSVAPRMFTPDPLGTEYWVIFGASDGYDQAAGAINQRDRETRVRGTHPLRVIPLTDASLLPTQNYGLDAVDVIAINGAVAIGERAAAAIRRWVEQGGHLVLTTDSPEAWDRWGFSSWVPVHNVRQVRLRDPVSDLNGLRGLIPRSAPFKDPRAVSALHFEPDAGETLVGTRNGPIWVRLPVGFGRVTMLGLDLAQRPLQTWDALPQLCERLADYRFDFAASRPQRKTTRLSRTGVSDLSTQLATAIDTYPHMEKVTNWMAMGLIVLYLLIIGPLDYLIVHRLLGRPHWTWITLPLIVLGSAALAATSARQHHPDRIASNQVNLIDLDTAGGRARTTSWSSFVSPQTRRWAVQTDFPEWSGAAVDAVAEASPSPSRLSWLGIPETGFRGMYRAGGLDLAKSQYRFAPGMTAMENVPVNMWSSLSVTSRRTGPVTDAEAIIASDLESAGVQLYGTISNRLDVPIDDWFIVHDNLAYFPKVREDMPRDLSFAPGETISMSGLRVLVLRNYLTGLRHVRVKREGTDFESDTAVRASYDPLSRDFDAIFRAISFYKAIGGKEFTTLENDALSRLDLSPLLGLNRAVLFGSIATSPAKLLVDGEPVEPAESATFLRVLMPVRSR